MVAAHVLAPIDGFWTTTNKEAELSEASGSETMSKAIGWPTQIQAGFTYSSLV